MKPGNIESLICVPDQCALFKLHRSTSTQIARGEPMTKATLHTLLASAVGAAALSLAVGAEPAQAFRVTYDFSLSIPTGDYAGTHRGSFSYDDTNLVGKGREIVNPTNDNLTVLFNFLGRIYTERDDADFFNTSNQFPKVAFQDGRLLGLSFLVLPPTADPGFLFVSEGSTVPGQPDPQPGFYIGSTPFTFGTRVAEVNYTLVSENSAAVPEPSEIAGSLLALGLLGIGLKRRQKGKATIHHSNH